MKISHSEKMKYPGKRNLLHQVGMIKFFPQIPQINAENLSATISKICGNYESKYYQFL